MTTDEILNLDYRKEKSKEIIQKVLRKIKPLSKYSEEEQIPIELIEKTVRVLCSKYNVTPQWMMMTYKDGIENSYSISIKTTTDHRWLGNVYGVCLYEVFSKLAIKIYSEVKNGNIGLLELTKEEKQREHIAKKIDKEKTS